MCVCVQTCVCVCVCVCEHSIVPEGSFKHDVMQLSGDATLCPQVLM